MTFKKLVQFIFPYFRVAVPTPETGEVWREECGAYPEEFYDWACAKLKAGKKAVLENFPASVNQLWDEWIRINPSKVEHHEFGCSNPACHRGIVSYYVRDDKGFWSLTGARCGDCRLQAGVNHGMLMLSERDIENDGYLLATWKNIQRAAEENAKRSRELYPERWEMITRNGRRKIADAVSVQDLERQLFGG